MFDKKIYINTGSGQSRAPLELTRREALVLGGAIALSPAFPALAAETIGAVEEVKGIVMRKTDASQSAIRVGDSISNNDFVTTGKESYASMKLGSDTKIIMGSETEVLIDSFLAEQGGTLELVSGDMVFDRPEGKPKIDLTIRTTFGQIGVRGTKFFTGNSDGKMAVFVEHGLVEVRSGMTIRKVGAGEGVDIAVDNKTRSLFGASISDTKKWDMSRINDAYKRVGLL